MRGSRFANKVLAAFPSLPFMAMGLWLAWTYIAFNSCSWISVTDLIGIRVAQIYISATAAMAITLLALQAMAPSLETAFGKRAFSIAGGVVSSTGALIIILIGPYVLGRFIDQKMSFSIFILGCIVAGAGGGLILAKIADTFARLFPRNVIVELACAVLVALALFFATNGVTIVHIGTNGPGVFQAFMFVALPALAGILISLDSPHVRFPHEHRSTDRSQLPAPFWRMTIVVGVLAFSESIVEAYANLALPLSTTMALFPFAQLFQGIVAIAFIAFAVTYDSTHMGFGRIVNGVMVLAVLFIALAAFAGAYNPLFYQLLPFAIRVFDFVYLCMLFFIMFQRRISGLLVFGASYGVFAACRTVGWAVGTLTFPQLDGTMYLILVSVALSLLTLTAAFMLFSEKQFDSLFESPDETQVPLSSLLDRKLNPPTTVVASNRGRFNIALDVVADEFGLTKREKDVLRQLAMGHDATRISEELDISWNTVRTHTRNVYTKLDVHSRQEVSDLVDSYKEQ